MAVLTMYLIKVFLFNKIIKYKNTFIKYIVNIVKFLILCQKKKKSSTGLFSVRGILLRAFCIFYVYLFDLFLRHTLLHLTAQTARPADSADRAWRNRWRAGSPLCDVQHGDEYFRRETCLLAVLASVCCLSQFVIIEQLVCLRRAFLNEF